ncbi:SRPBCC family protein [Virgibacillus sp. JSM 102003]|uniref:SRPBCC family protein n=1 Tax=Virgibacillus sp. JSM 102003 TaxID=1562108 RepID=UPI0035C20512
MAFNDATNNNTSEKIPDREIVNTRIFHASREQIFKAFSNPDKLKKWWGPKGFTNTFFKFDMNPGGHWHYVMHGPDGIDYENKSVFLEVVESEKIALRHLEPDHEFLLTITLSELDGQTKLTWHMLFDTPDECNKVKSFVIKANEQNLDRLDDQLKLSY